VLFHSVPDREDPFIQACHVPRQCRSISSILSMPPGLGSPSSSKTGGRAGATSEHLIDRPLPASPSSPSRYEAWPREEARSCRRFGKGPALACPKPPRPLSLASPTILIIFSTMSLPKPNWAVYSSFPLTPSSDGAARSPSSTASAPSSASLPRARRARTARTVRRACSVSNPSG
jgi:hypothetical protein